MIKSLGGRTRSRALSFLHVCNSKSFYCFSPWEKAALHFQCILKSLFHAKTVSEFSIGTLYATTCLYLYVTSLTKNIRECRLVYHDQVISIRLEVNRAIDPHWSLPNLSTRAVTSLILPCILLYTILWNVNYTTCAWTLFDPPWLKALHVILAAILVGSKTIVQFWCSHSLFLGSGVVILLLPEAPYSGREACRNPATFSAHLLEVGVTYVGHSSILSVGLAW